MKPRLLAPILVVMLTVALAPTALAGDLAVTDYTSSPDPVNQGDDITVKAKVISSATITSVIAFPCWELPTYVCGSPETMTDADSDGYYEATIEAKAAWTDGNTIHINITAKDEAGDSVTVSLPHIIIGGGSAPCDKPENCTNESDCEGAGFYWWDDACHAKDKEASDFTTQTSCENAGHYWWSSTCHDAKGAASVYTTKDECVKVGYYWWDGKCNDKKKPSDDGGGGFIPGFGALALIAAAVVALSIVLGRRK